MVQKEKLEILLKKNPQKTKLLLNDFMGFDDIRKLFIKVFDLVEFFYVDDCHPFRFFFQIS